MNDVALDTDSENAPHGPRGWIIHARNLGILLAVLIIVARYLPPGATPQKIAEQEINSQLSSALALTLPGGTKVIHAKFHQSQDPINFFELELPPGQTSPFVASVANQGRKPYRVMKNATPLMGSTAFGRAAPVWWRNGMPPDEMFLELQANDGSIAFLFFSSPSADRIFLCWLEF